jgi:hypothetical protein
LVGERGWRAAETAAARQLVVATPHTIGGWRGADRAASALRCALGM